MELGYAFSSEQHTPLDLVRHARLAEEAGFGYGLISDHYHPWVDAQGHSLEVMRLLWQGGYQTHRGKHYTVDHARVFDLPDEPVQIAVAAAQPLAAEKAGEIGDALIVVEADKDIVKRFEEGGGKGSLALGPDPGEWLRQIEEYRDAGVDHVYIHHIGPDQEGFLEFAKRELLPAT